VSTDHNTEPDVEEAPVAQPPRRVVMLAIVAAVVLTLDLVTKIVAVASLEGREPLKLLGGVLYLPLIRNGGAAFGLAEGWTAILALIAFGVVGFIIWIARKLRSVGWAIGLGLVLGGALGNLVDRVFRAPGPLRGHVVDFLSLFDPYGRVWPVFNLADSAICVGGALIVLMALLQRDYDGTRVVKKEKA
jgi:signal peptidase II